ncbi:DUF2190 domain-containing protein [bacterium]|nr:DUF2190 domain-containing protein [bacterium]
MPLVKNRTEGADLFVAEGSINPYSIVKPGTDKNAAGTQMVVAAAATDLDMMGAIQNADAVVAGAQIRLPNIGENALVKLGGTVVVGDRLTSGAAGVAVAAAPAAGVNNGTIGVAGQSGVSGDIIVYKHNPMRIQG